MYSFGLGFSLIGRIATGALAVVLSGSLTCSHAQQPGRAEQPVLFDVKADPITSFDVRDPSRVRFGALDFRGGLDLTSSHKDFGGFSGLRIEQDGSRFIAVSDRGRWWRGRILYRNNQPIGIADSEMSLILGPDGRPVKARGWYDTESLARDDGTLYVGIERVHQILRFDYRRHGLFARGIPIPVPPEIKPLSYNMGLECLVFASDGSPLAGTLIAVAERSLDGDGNHKGVMIGGPRPGSFAVKRTDDYDISDCAQLPNSDLLLLERRFSPFRGGGIRIRRIAVATIKPGAVLDGPSLIEADLGYQIDNMEGLAVHRHATGETVLTLISDDNFSAIQRTILLQFTMAE